MGAIGDKIRVVLREKKISIKDFSKMIGLSEPSVYNMLKSDKFKLSTIQKIANVLQLNPNILIDEPTSVESNIENPKTLVNKKRLEAAMSMSKILEDKDGKFHSEQEKKILEYNVLTVQIEVIESLLNELKQQRDSIYLNLL